MSIRVNIEINVPDGQSPTAREEAVLMALGNTRRAEGHVATATVTGQLVDAVKDRVESGKYKEGGELPSGPTEVKNETGEPEETTPAPAEEEEKPKRTRRTKEQMAAARAEEEAAAKANSEAEAEANAPEEEPEEVEEAPKAEAKEKAPKAPEKEEKDGEVSEKDLRDDMRNSVIGFLNSKERGEKPRDELRKLLKDFDADRVPDIQLDQMPEFIQALKDAS